MPEVKPLLVVAGSTVSVMIVPNNNRQMAIQFGAFMAKHDLQLDLSSQGMITGIHSNEDSTAVPLAFIDLLKTAVSTGHPLGQAFAGKVGTEGQGRLQIYDVVFDDDGNLVGLRPLIRDRDLLRVPIAMSGPSVPQTPSQPQKPPSPGGNNNPTPAPTPTPDCKADPKAKGCPAK